MRALWMACFISIFLPGVVFAKSVPSDWKYVEKRLNKAGFSRGFVAKLKANYDAVPLNEVVELNTLLFLKKSDYHGPQVDDEAVETVRAFLGANRATLEQSQKTYAVPGEVVASLI